MVGNVRLGEQSGEWDLWQAGNQHTLESIKIASRQTRQTLMMARVLVAMTMMMLLELFMIIVTIVVAVSAGKTSRGCCSPRLCNQHSNVVQSTMYYNNVLQCTTINIPVKALKLQQKPPQALFVPSSIITELFLDKKKIKHVGMLAPPQTKPNKSI